MARKVLITGAAGFIGSATAEALLAAGDEVVGLDCLNDYYKVAWKEQNVADLSRYQNFTFVKADILDEAALQKLGEQHQFDQIIHLAARAGVRPSIADPKLYEAVNIRGTLNILEMAKTYQVPKVVFASSSSVYGNRKETPFSEDDRVDLPVSPYAATKKSCEELAFTYSHLYGLSCIGLRFFTVYGPKGRPDMAPYLFTEALLTGKPMIRFGSGDSGRDYTFINDTVSGILGAMGYQTTYDIFNLGNSSPVLLNEFIKILEDITGQKAIINQQPKQPGDVDVTFANIAKAQQKLGYNPQTSLRDGLSEFVSWYKQHRLQEVSK